MFKYTSIYVNTISLLISLIVFIVIQTLFLNYGLFTKKSSLKASFEVENVVQKTTNEIVDKKTKRRMAVHLKSVRYLLTNFFPSMI